MNRFRSWTVKKTSTIVTRSAVGTILRIVRGSCDFLLGFARVIFKKIAYFDQYLKHKPYCSFSLG